MLKLKDNVELKELEKFGFYKMKKGYYKSYVLMTNESEEDEPYISICNYDGEIKSIMLCGHGFIHKLGQDTLYDLIKADLVEKVK